MQPEIAILATKGAEAGKNWKFKANHTERVDNVKMPEGNPETKLSSSIKTSHSLLGRDCLCRYTKETWIKII